MRSPAPVADYLDALEGALSFDAALARRVRREAADHLWESVDAAVARDIPGAAAEARAVAGFGDPRALARAYAAISLFRQTRRLGMTAVLVPAGIFLAMWLRFFALGGMLRLSGDIERIRAVVLAVDFWSFRAAFAIGLVLLVGALRRRVPAAFHERQGTELRRYLLLCMAGAAAAALSVLADAVLVGMRLWLTGPPTTLAPLLSIATEIVLVAALFLHLRAAFRRRASVAALAAAGA
jgi:hypothetical protein